MAGISVVVAIIVGLISSFVQSLGKSSNTPDDPTSSPGS
jgi:type III secretory pathway component EscS